MIFWFDNRLVVSMDILIRYFFFFFSGQLRNLIIQMSVLYLFVDGVELSRTHGQRFSAVCIGFLNRPPFGVSVSPTTPGERKGESRVHATRFESLRATILPDASRATTRKWTAGHTCWPQSRWHTCVRKNQNRKTSTAAGGQCDSHSSYSWQSWPSGGTTVALLRPFVFQPSVVKQSGAQDYERRRFRTS